MPQMLSIKFNLNIILTPFHNNTQYILHACNAIKNLKHQTLNDELGFNLKGLQ